MSKYKATEVYDAMDGLAAAAKHLSAAEEAYKVARMRLCNAIDAEKREVAMGHIELRDEAGNIIRPKTQPMMMAKG